MTETQGKNRKIQENYTDIVRLHREEIRRTKAQLELLSNQDCKDNKKGFYKYISNKRKVKENLHPLLGVEGNILTGDEEKAGILMLSLPQSLIVTPILLKIPSPLRWKPEMGSRMKTP